MWRRPLQEERHREKSGHLLRTTSQSTPAARFRNGQNQTFLFPIAPDQTFVSLWSLERPLASA
jgi:hypothetical protein